MVQHSHPYMTTGKTIALTRWTFVGKVIFLLSNMLSRLVIAFLPRSKHLLTLKGDSGAINSWVVLLPFTALKSSYKSKYCAGKQMQNPSSETSEQGKLASVHSLYFIHLLLSMDQCPIGPHLPNTSSKKKLRISRQCHETMKPQAGCSSEHQTFSAWLSGLQARKLVLSSRNMHAC